MHAVVLIKRHPVFYRRVISCSVAVPSPQINAFCLIDQIVDTFWRRITTGQTPGDNGAFYHDTALLIEPQMLIGNVDFYVAGANIVGTAASIIWYLAVYRFSAYILFTF